MISVEQWRQAGHFFEHNNQQIFFRDQGQGEPLVLIHGFPAASWDWRLLWPKLSQHYRVIAIDMLGFGFSDKPKQHHYSTVEQADIHIALMNRLNIKQYHLLAHDFGTLVAQELLSRGQLPHQAQAISLFAMSGSIFPQLSRPRLIQKLLISKMGPVISRLFSKKKFSKNFSQVFAAANPVDEKTIDDYWQLLCEKQGNKMLHRLNFFITDRRCHGQRWANIWQATDTPIRYLGGQQDPMYGGDTLIKLKQLSEKKDIISLPGVGHFPHLEAADEVLQSISDFLGPLQFS